MKKFFGLIFTLIFAWMMIYALTPNTDATVSAKDFTVEESLFLRAEPLCRKGKMAEGIPDMERVLKLNPEHPGALYYLGVNYFLKKDIKTAQEFFKRVLNDPAYGPLARQKLADFSLERRRASDLSAIKSYLDGGAFAECFRECKAALMHSAKDPEILFFTTFSACLSGNQKYAEAAFRNFEMTGSKPEIKTDLRSFLDAWSCKDHAPREALERFMSITDPRIKNAFVRKTIRNLMLNMKLFDDYEKLLFAERETVGTDKSAIERELIKFYIDVGQYDKGLRLMNERPIDQLIDNLLFIELLTLTANEEKAMNFAVRLLETGIIDESLHEGYLKAFAHYTNRTGALPTGKASNGETFEKIAGDEIERMIRSGMAVKNPRTLFNSFQVAIVLHKPQLTSGLMDKILKVSLDDSIMPDVLAATQEMMSKGMWHEATTFLEGALSQRPDDSVIQRGLAESYFLANRSAEALTLIENSLTTDPSSHKAFMIYVDCLAANGRTNEAIAKIADRLTDPNTPEIIARQLKAKAFVLSGEAAAANTGSQTGQDAGSSGDSSSDTSTSTGSSGNGTDAPVIPPGLSPGEPIEQPDVPATVNTGGLDGYLR